MSQQQTLFKFLSQPPRSINALPLKPHQGRKRPGESGENNTPENGRAKVHSPDSEEDESPVRIGKRRKIDVDNQISTEGSVANSKHSEGGGRIIVNKLESEEQTTESDLSITNSLGSPKAVARTRRSPLSTVSQSTLSQLSQEDTLIDNFDDQTLSMMDVFGQDESESESDYLFEDSWKKRDSKESDQATSLLENLIQSNEFNPPVVRSLNLDSFTNTNNPQEEEEEEDSEKCSRFLYQCSQDLRNNLYWRSFVEMYYNHHNHFCFPSWIDPSKMKDLKGNTPMDTSFDLSAVRVSTNSKGSTDDKMHFTPAMLQFWEMKASNFDKVVFFKLGKFYEIFYVDACIVQPICDLKWMGNDEKAHVGFPESSLHSQAKKVVDSGLSVTIVEQMETPEELHQRAKTDSQAAKSKAVRREICEVYSQGTLANHQMIGPEPNFLCSIYFNSQCDPNDSTGGFSTVLVDVAGLNIYYETYPREEGSQQILRTLLAHTAPKEMLIQRLKFPEKTLTVIRTLPKTVQLTQLSSDKNVSPPSALDAVGVLLLSSEVDNGKQELINACKESDSLSVCCYQALTYLDSLLLSNRLVAFGKFEKWSDSTAGLASKNRMILDATTMRALDILSSSCGEKQSLYSAINNCSTAFGKRLLMRWISAPLLSISEINMRQDAVEWFIEHPNTLSKLRSKLSELPDLERLIAKTTGMVLQSERGAVYFTETIQRRIKQFLSLMESFALVQEIRDDLDSIDIAPDSRLRLLVQLVDNGGFYPNLIPIIGDLTKYIDVKDGVYRPQQGACEAFDEYGEKIVSVERRLAEYIENELWETVGMDRPSADIVKYVNSKFRYEVEVPDKLWKEISKRTVKNSRLNMTSTRAGYTRFQSEDIKEMLAELTPLEAQQQNTLFPFMQQIFKRFHAKADRFSIAHQILAEIDIYASFAYQASSWTQPMTQIGYTRPEIVESNTSFISVDQGLHPVLVQNIQNFVPNSFQISTNEEPARSLIITGPNMGGKSTLARQVALLTILAQVGSYVPARKMVLTPIDRIFTRIGARDAIMEGKSTFFVELEETITALNQATPRSLVIMDELGRGTSIEEGSAIALATLEYITNTNKSLCLFSTHFQDYFAKSIDQNDKRIAPFHMAFESDEKERRLVFKYQFVPGECPRSHGLKVAKLAGIPEDVLRIAQEYQEQNDR